MCPGRVAEQAKYFAVTAAQALQIGLEAERFTRQQLARPFTVRTCKQDARGRSWRKRYFAFVQIDNADLGELLVANGLARVFGAASEPPEMNTPRVEWRRLKQLERRAKEQKIGGWGVGIGSPPHPHRRSTAVVVRQEARREHSQHRGATESIPGIDLVLAQENRRGAPVPQRGRPPSGGRHRRETLRGAATLFRVAPRRSVMSEIATAIHCYRPDNVRTAPSKSPRTIDTNTIRTP